MTLIELVIVLGILTALSGMALSLVNEMGGSQRRDRTRDRLDQIELALTGDALRPGKFVSDMGRLPVLDRTAAEGKRLRELWNGDIFKFAYAVKDDPTPRVPRPFVEYIGYKGELNHMFSMNHVYVSLPCGWSGPYLNIRSDNLYDGFGNAFRVNVDLTEVESEDLPVWPADTIMQVASFGSDDKPDENYDNNFPNHASPGDDWQKQDDVRTVRDTQILASLSLRIVVRDSSGGIPVWTPPENGKGAFAAYNATTDYVVGAIVRPGKTLIIPGGEQQPDTTITSQCEDWDLFLCVKQDPNVTGELNPVWKRTSVVIDAKGNHWQWLPNCNKMTHLRAAVFSPYVDTHTTIVQGGEKLLTGIRCTTAVWSGNEWSIGDSEGNDNETGDFVTYVYPVNGEPTTETGLVMTETVNGNEYPDASPVIDVEGGSPTEVYFTNLTPGIRKLMVYGFINLGTDASHVVCNAFYSPVQTIDLKPGANTITIYLTEPFFK